MDINIKTKTKTDVTQQFREMAEKGATQSKEAFEKMNAATGQAANVMQNWYSIALKGAQDYNSKLTEFTQANIHAAMDFAQKISGAKSPSEFVELSAQRTQQHVATLTEQTKELAALAQRVTLATAEPLKTGFTKTSA
jgi:phasin